MFERFTDESRRVLMLAQEEARLLGHSFIGTEHILLGLADEEQGVAAEVLRRLDLSSDAIRREVRNRVPDSPHPVGSPPFTARAKKALELSLREALHLNHHSIGTEHLLLGLVREGEGVAAQVLEECGAPLHQVRDTVLTLIGAPAPSPARADVSRADVPARPAPAGPTCPRCRTLLAGVVRYRTLPVPPDEASGSGEPLSAAAVYCGSCGLTIGLAAPTASPGGVTAATVTATVGDVAGADEGEGTGAGAGPDSPADAAPMLGTTVSFTVRGHPPATVTGTVGDRVVDVQLAGHTRRAATGSVGDAELLVRWEPGEVSRDEASGTTEVPVSLSGTLGGHQMVFDGAFHLDPDRHLESGRVEGELEGHPLAARLHRVPGAGPGTVAVEGTLGPVSFSLLASVAADRSGATVQGAVGDRPVELLASASGAGSVRTVQLVGSHAGPLALLVATVGALVHCL